MNAQLQVRMLHAVCKAVDEMLAEHTYGEFLEAGMRCGRDAACRAAEILEQQDRDAVAHLQEPSTIVYDPKGKAGR